MSPDLSIFSALRNAGVNDEAARSAVEAINQVIDNRFNVHFKQLATQGDTEKLRVEIEKVRVEIEKNRADLIKSLAESRMDLIKWIVSMAIAGPALAAVILRLI